MDNKIIIGTRGSKLSSAYAEKVKKLILETNRDINKEIVIKSIKTSGDMVQNKRISEIGGKNLFCKEIEDNLLRKKIDIAVHSLKDMDSVETKGLMIKAYVKRNDPRESFVSKKLSKLPDLDNAKIGSSSRRRELQLKLFNKNINVEYIRGNVDTRIKKVENGDYDGVILATAGLKTLKLENYIKETLSEKDFIPTVGQGVIAAQCRQNDDYIKKILEKINHKETEICASAERNFLKVLGGDCDTAVGCLTTISKESLELRAQLFSDDGKKVFTVTKFGKLDNPTLLGKIAGEEILKKSGNFFKKKK